jgi:hypothetical protein
MVELPKEWLSPTDWGLTTRYEIWVESFGELSVCQKMLSYIDVSIGRKGLSKRQAKW